MAVDLVSVTPDGLFSGTNDVVPFDAPSAKNPAISGNGRFVVYQSKANDLVPPQDATVPLDTNDAEDVFIYDFDTGLTTLISVNFAGTDSGSGPTGLGSFRGASFSPAISDDGRYVAFVSFATDLVKQTVDTKPNVFVRDLDVDGDGIFNEPGDSRTRLLSIGLDGTGSGPSGDDISGTSPEMRPVISSDGMMVAFGSGATDLAISQMLPDGSPLPDGNGGFDVFVAAVDGSTLELVSINEAGTATTNKPFGAASANPSLDFSGSAIAFQSSGIDLTDMVLDGTQNVFVGGSETTLVSINAGGDGGGNAPSRVPVISRNGRHVAFISGATDLISGIVDANGAGPDIYVRDLLTEKTTLVSRSGVTPDSTGNLGSTSLSADKHFTQGPSVSADGRFIAFASSASDLLDPSGGIVDENARIDIFVLDRDSDRNGEFDEPGGTEMILASVNEETMASGIGGFFGASNPTLSGNGRFVAFATDDLLIPGSETGMNVYVRDLVEGTTFLVSPGGGASGGPPAAGGSDSNVVISNFTSSIGRTAYVSTGIDLDPDVTDANTSVDVYAFTPATDIRLTRNFATGSTEHGQSFRVLLEATPEFDVGYYRSSDSTFDAGDELLGTASVTDPDDLGVDGNRFVITTIGEGTGEVAFPGVGEADALEDYFILAVADHLDEVIEFDGDPFNEDNSRPVRGVYHLKGEPVFAHGSAGSETITATVLGETLEFAYGATAFNISGTFTYDLAEVTEVRVRTHDGDDTVRGSDLTEIIFGGDGSDDLSGAGGDDMLFGGPGKDRLDGGEGADTLDGGDGPDAILGGPGDDIVLDGPGDDQVDVGDGDDTLFSTPGSADVFIDTGGIDTLDFSLASLPITIDLDSTAVQTVDAAGNTIRLIGDWENIVGTPLDDDATIRATPRTFPRAIDGGDGIDTLIIDALNNIVVDHGARLSFPNSGLGDISYVNIENLRVLNARPNLVLIDGRDPGFTSVGFTEIDDPQNPQGLGGSIAFAGPSDAVDSNATWTFNGLSPGFFFVSTTWTAAPDRATNAPYKIFTDGELRQEVRVNQEQEPKEFFEQGVFWKNLGLVEVFGSTLTVELTDDANDFVIADAVRISPFVTETGASPILVDDAPNHAPAGDRDPATIREATGPIVSVIHSTITAFRADLGGVENGDLAPQSTGTRTITWEEIDDFGATPEFLPLDYYNTTFPRGMQLHTRGDGIQVSNSTQAEPRFSNLNPSYLASFSAATQERVMTPIGDNVVDVRFFVPGSDTPAAVRGFGAVFTDVDNFFTTQIEFFDVAGEQLASRFVPATASEGSLSFTGLTFDDPLIASVRITAGDGALLLSQSPNDVSQAGGELDLVVMDDFIFGEPVAITNPAANSGYSSDCSPSTGPGFWGDQHTCNPGQSATWTFSSVPNGTYNVSATWIDGRTHPTNATYTIDHDGQQHLIPVNQQLPPDDFFQADNPFENLAKIRVENGQGPTVTLTGDRVFSADAIQLLPGSDLHLIDPDGNTVANGSTVDLGPIPRDDQGVATVTRRFTIRNNFDSAPLAVSDLAVTGAGFSVSGFGATWIPAGASTTFDVSYSGNVSGRFSGQVTFNSNDVSNQVSSIDWMGEAVEDTTPPIITILAPEDGATYIEGTDVTIPIDVDDDGVLRAVDVLFNDVIAGTLTEAPFEFRGKLPTGVTSVEIGARAHDVSGNAGVATAITLSLLEDQPPLINIESPVDGQGVVSGSTIRLVVGATDDVEVQKVELLINDTAVVPSPFGNAFDPGFAATLIALPADPAVSEVEIRICATDSIDQVTCQSITLNAFEAPVIDFGKLVIGPEAGGPLQVKVTQPNGDELFKFTPYDSSVAGGVRVATGDVTGDGTPDIITGAGPGGGPHVKVFDGATGATLNSFFAFDRGFTGGVFVAAGDVSGDGFDDIVVGADAGTGAGPHVRVFDGVTGNLHASFFAFEPGFAGGVRVAVGDVNGDGQDDIVTAAGAGGGPHVRVFDGHTASQLPTSGEVPGQQILADFFAFESTLTGGVFVAVGDLNGDALEDIIFGADQGGSMNGGHVKALDSAFLPAVQRGGQLDGQGSLANFLAFDLNFNGGVRVATGDVNHDGRSDIITGAGPGSSSVKVFDGTSGNEIESFELGSGFDGSAVVSSNQPLVAVVSVAPAGGTTRIAFESGDLVVRDQGGNEIDRVPADSSKAARINAPSDVEDKIVFDPGFFFDEAEPPTMNPLRAIVDGGPGGNDVFELEPGEVEGFGIAINSFGACAVGRCNERNLRAIVDDKSIELKLVDVESVHDNLNVIDREFNFSVSDDNIVLDSGFDGTDAILRIEVNGVPTLFRQPSGKTTVKLGDGTDTFRFDLSIDLLPTLDGQGGEDTLVLTNTGQHLDLTDPNQNKPLNIERIDIIGASPNQLTLDRQSVIDATDPDNMMVLVHDEDDTVHYAGDGWTVEAPIFVDGQQRHVLTNGQARVEAINTSPFQNPFEPTDVNFIDGTTILDALQIINFIGRFDGVFSVDLGLPTSESELPERYYDVNGNGMATAGDAIVVINFVGRRVLAEQEGEVAQATAAPIVAPILSLPIQFFAQTETDRLILAETIESTHDLALRELAWNTTGTAQENAQKNATATLTCGGDDADQIDLTPWDRVLTGLLERYSGLGR